MARVRGKQAKGQRSGTTAATVQVAIPLDDGTVTTPVTVAMIQALFHSACAR